MRQFFAAVGSTVVGIVAAVVAVIGVSFGGWLLYRELGPRYAAVERTIFESSPSYVQGKIAHLNRLRLEYERSDEGAKSNLREIILVEAASIDNSKLPKELQGFVVNVQKGAVK